MQTHDIVHGFDTKVDYVHLHMFSCTHIARLFAYPYSYTYRFVHVLKAAVYCPRSCANIDFASIWVLDLSRADCARRMPEDSLKSIGHTG